MTDIPSYELVHRMMYKAGFDVQDPNEEPAFPNSKFMKLAYQAAQWGANQELEACCDFLDDNELCDPDFHKDLRNHRRPSLKEQALRGLKEIGDFTLGEFEGSSGFEVFQTHVDNIRRALEQLPE